MPRVVRVEVPGELHRTHHRRPEIEPETLELRLQETVVELRVVRDEQASAQAGQGLGGHGRKRRGGRHHGIADAGELLDEGGDGLARIDQLLPLADAAVRIDFNNSDFGDPIFAGGGAGGFQVDKG